MKRILAATAVALALVLGGCSSTDDYPDETAQSLQEGVVAVTQLSAAGDWAGASLALDDVAARLAQAIQAGEITDDRAQDISIAIEIVRARLQDLIDAQQPAPEAPTEGNGNGNGNGNGPPDKDDKDKPGKKD